MPLRVARRSVGVHCDLGSIYTAVAPKGLRNSRLRIRIISGLMTGFDEAGHGAPDLLNLCDCLHIHAEWEVAEAVTGRRYMSDARPSEVISQ
jgi:hypothetical protein